MDVDEFLRSAELPNVAVDTEAALSHTLVRGRRRSRRVRLVGACGGLVVFALIGVAVVIARSDGPTRVDTTSPGIRAVPATPEPGDPATWTIDPASPPSTERSSFSALVTRLGCNGGVTGAVLRPGVQVLTNQIVVTFNVEADPNGGRCPINDRVPYEVDLGIRLGGRTLVDGGCSRGSAAEHTSFCEDDAGVRWRPPRSSEDAIAGDSLVIATTDGRVIEIGAGGSERRELITLDAGRVEALSLHPDRRRIFVGERIMDSGSSNCTGKIVELHPDGTTRDVADGSVPAVSPDGSRLAFVRLERIDDICYRTEIEVLDLSTGETSHFTLDDRIPDGTPPEVPISWAPDGSSIAFVDNAGAALLQLAEPGASRITPVPSDDQRLLLPTFVDNDALVALAGCCIGPGHLVRVDLHSGAITNVAETPVPAVALLPATGEMPTIAVTADGQLLALDDGAPNVLRRDVAYAAR